MREIQERWVQSLGQEDPLKKEIVTHCSILAWKAQWTKEPGGWESKGSQSWTPLSTHAHTQTQSEYIWFSFSFQQCFTFGISYLASLVVHTVKVSCLQRRRPKFNPWVRKIPWRKAWRSTPVVLPGEFHGQRSLMGYSPWGCKDLDITEWLTLSITSHAWSSWIIIK